MGHLSESPDMPVKMHRLMASGWGIAPELGGKSSDQADGRILGAASWWRMSLPMQATADLKP